MCVCVRFEVTTIQRKQNGAPRREKDRNSCIQKLAKEKKNCFSLGYLLKYSFIEN